jgi:uncharacterized membrane protein
MRLLTKFLTGVLVVAPALLAVILVSGYLAAPTSP